MEKQIKNDASFGSTEKKLDYKKEYKDLYQPKAKPSLIRVPSITFLMVDGKGNPNDPAGEYQTAVGLLYALSYAIKMSEKGPQRPLGYFSYVVPPLEGLWWLSDNKEIHSGVQESYRGEHQTHTEEKVSGEDYSKKDRFCWTSMIRQPEFINQEILDWAREEVLRKKPEFDPSTARLVSFEEGLCIQMMHLGPYDDEPRSLAEMEQFLEENNLCSAVGQVLGDGTVRRHHEIYLNDPRKTAQDKLKTILRCPVE
ncbi:transcriptional regulator [Anoxybacterium hadale]|uniref:Transcriptional regulator n=1 Tax=Anoxybacterium hadale TaxID=3408580 RepID=A0ACD1AFW0_9FIRM|nr:transcriptional regulator [Clostridiales bacterium]